MGIPVWEQHSQIEDAVLAPPYGCVGVLASCAYLNDTGGDALSTQIDTKNTMQNHLALMNPAHQKPNFSNCGSMTGLVRRPHVGAQSQSNQGIGRKRYVQSKGCDGRYWSF
jgi:hypothetical protein